jgi:biopolymer transport protein ExbB/TolQ
MLANSLIKGFLDSNLTGQLIVWAQLLGSAVMLAVIIGKWHMISGTTRTTKRVSRDIMTGRDVLEYYLQRHPNSHSAIENIYTATCERLLKLLTPDARSLLVGRAGEGLPAALTAHEVGLVKAICEHVLEEEEMRLEHGMGAIATVVALSPMLGLLGTVWGVLDAFAEMGAAGNATISTLAPSISAALVTTVVGLLIAIPGVLAYNHQTATIRGIISDMEGFADDLMGRIALEFQGRGA